MPDASVQTRPLSSGARIVAFVGITNPGASRAFYRDTLGLQLVTEDAFALAFNVQGTSFRATIVNSVTPAPYTVLGWEVPDIGATVRALRDAGVALERVSGLQQDEFGIWTAPGGTRVAWFRDPDDNWLSVSQHP
jgi:catechol 2,3-dioxygenase-like lactoylglutathione lyase family enzyme